MTRWAPLVGWVGGIDAVVGRLTGSLMLKRWDGDNNEFELALGPILDSNSPGATKTHNIKFYFYLIHTSVHFRIFPVG